MFLQYTLPPNAIYYVGCESDGFKALDNYEGLHFKNIKYLYGLLLRYCIAFEKGTFQLHVKSWLSWNLEQIESYRRTPMPNKRRVQMLRLFAM